MTPQRDVHGAGTAALSEVLARAATELASLAQACAMMERALAATLTDKDGARPSLPIAMLAPLQGLDRCRQELAEHSRMLEQAARLPGTGEIDARAAVMAVRLASLHARLVQGAPEARRDAEPSGTEIWP